MYGSAKLYHDQQAKIAEAVHRRLKQQEIESSNQLEPSVVDNICDDCGERHTSDTACGEI